MVIFTLLFAWSQRYMHDDPFISFRYARNLADGNGLVYNIGERVEGYTNFLWTLLMTIPHKLGADPILFSHALGLALLGISLTLFYKLGRIVFYRQQSTLLLLLGIILNYSFITSYVNGLGTALEGTMVIANLYVYVRLWSGNHPSICEIFGTSILFSISLLTRLDLTVIVFPLAVFTLLHLLISRKMALEKSSMRSYSREYPFS
jgi:arabinofuranosyltransferase